MIWLKKNLLFTIAMVVLGAILAVEIFMILSHRAQAQAVEAQFLAKVNEYQRLAGQGVLPHPRNIDLTAAEIERREEDLHDYKESFTGETDLVAAFADYPRSRADAYFDIASFVTEYRVRARNAVVENENLDNTYFGFQAYSEVGPVESLIPTVYKQRLIVAYILDRLFEARPQQLIEVRRPGETLPVVANGDQQAVHGRSATREESGIFRLNPQLTAAIPDVATTSAYQVEFTGRASTLRAFLNELTSFEMPLIVRSVQVAPASEAEARRRQATERRQPAERRLPRRTQVEEEIPVNGESEQPRQRGERIPLVADNLSRFTVAMEFIDVNAGEEPSRQ